MFHNEQTEENIMLPVTGGGIKMCSVILYHNAWSEQINCKAYNLSVAISYI